jgi:hypothetical protein
VTLHNAQGGETFRSPERFVRPARQIDTRRASQWCYGHPGEMVRQQEDAMAKGKDKGNKEAKKPKADKNAPKTGGGSAYKQAQGKGASTVNPFGKK